MVDMSVEMVTVIQGLNGTSESPSTTAVVMDTVLNAKIRTYLHAHPDQLKICDTQTLVFNESQMIGRFDKHTLFIFNHSSHLAYGPQITKVGSTSAKTALRNILKTTNNEKEMAPSEVREPLGHYTFYAFVRHPLKRFLAGFHQIEVFWRMGWFDPYINKFHLQWWNKSCTLQTDSCKWTVKSKHQCTGSDPNQDLVTRLGRLHAFMDDIARVGFFDQHVMPISYQFSVNTLFANLKSKETQLPVIFDIASMNQVHDSLSELVRGRNLSKQEKIVQMSRNNAGNSMDPSMPWVVTWAELTTIVTSMQHPDHEVASAKTAIERMCRMFQNDIQCLPYDIPECQ